MKRGYVRLFIKAPTESNKKLYTFSHKQPLLAGLYPAERSHFDLSPHCKGFGICIIFLYYQVQEYQSQVVSSLANK
jgi:hypothetical protein